MKDDERRFRQLAEPLHRAGKQIDAEAVAKEAKVSPKLAYCFLRRLEREIGAPKVTATLRGVPLDAQLKARGRKKEADDDGTIRRHAKANVDAEPRRTDD